MGHFFLPCHMHTEMMNVGAFQPGENVLPEFESLIAIPS